MPLIRISNTSRLREAVASGKGCGGLLESYRGPINAILSPNMVGVGNFGPSTVNAVAGSLALIFPRSIRTVGKGERRIL